MHINDTQNTNAGNAKFHRGMRHPVVSQPEAPLTPAIDTLRIYAPHEAGYWAAQRAGFAIIQTMENALRDRDQWAGRYTGWFNRHTEEYEDLNDCSGQFDDAHRYAVDLAADACLGNAHGIILAQGRNDEVAQLIRAAFDRETEARNRAAMTD